MSACSHPSSHFKSERATWLSRYPNIEIKRENLVELGNKSLQRALITLNIIVGFKRMGIWPLKLDALVENMSMIKTYQFNIVEIVFAVLNILSLLGVVVSTYEVA